MHCFSYKTWFLYLYVQTSRTESIPISLIELILSTRLVYFIDFHEALCWLHPRPRGVFLKLWRENSMDIDHEVMRDLYRFQAGSQINWNRAEWNKKQRASGNRKRAIHTNWQFIQGKKGNVVCVCREEWRPLDKWPHSFNLRQIGGVSGAGH